MLCRYVCQKKVIEIMIIHHDASNSILPETILFRSQASTVFTKRLSDDKSKIDLMQLFPMTDNLYSLWLIRLQWLLFLSGVINWFFLLQSHFRERLITFWQIKSVMEHYNSINFHMAFTNLSYIRVSSLYLTIITKHLLIKWSMVMLELF